MANVIRVLVTVCAATVLVGAEANWAAVFLRDTFTGPVPMGQRDQACRRDSEVFQLALGRLEPWALHMYDSSGKIPSGIITGNIVELGHYDQCLSVKAPNFRGRHCSAAITVFLLPDAGENVTSGGLRDLVLAVAKSADVDDVKSTVTYRWSLCVPSTCSPKDVESGLATALAPLDSGSSGVRTSVVVDESSCSAVEDSPFTPADYAFIVLASLIILAVVSSTIYDFYFTWKRQDAQGGCKPLLAMSLRTNWRSLWNTSADSEKFACVYGVRFLSIAWIVLGHSYYVATTAPQINLIDVSQWRYQWHKMSMMTGTVSTDSFFVIGAALMTVNFMRQCIRNNSCPNILKMYFLRYIRLTPAYALVVFFYATVMRFCGDGPLWEQLMVVETTKCIASWWTNLLYINNYMHLSQQCLNQTWYLAVDFQLLLFAPILLVPMWKLIHRPVIVSCILGCFLSLSIASPLIVTAVKGLAGAMLYGTDNNMVGAIFVSVYLPAYTRAGPFIVGIILGYILHYYDGEKLPLGKWTVAALWASCVALLLVCIYGILPQYAYAPRVRPVEAALFAGFQRTTWAVAVAWMILACCKNLGGPVNAFLSMPVMLPLGKLSYCVYLTHYIFVNYNVATQRTAGAILDYTLVVHTIGTLAVALAAATVLHLTVELPSLSLSRIYFRGSEMRNNIVHSIAPSRPPSHSPNLPSIPPSPTPPSTTTDEIFENKGFVNDSAKPSTPAVGS